MVLKQFLTLKKIIHMEYLNEYHKESVERKMEKIKQQKKLVLNAEEEAKRHFEMHKRLAKDSAKKNNEGV